MAIPVDAENAQSFARSIGSGKDANGSDDTKVVARQEIGNRRKRRSRRGRVG